MKKTALSLLLTLFCAFGLFASNGGVASNEATLTAQAEDAVVDYAAQAVLDFDADTQTIEVSVKTFVDGDTTHFFAEGFDNGVLKARYMAVNTPESTGKLEEWGKKASKFTRSKLETATSIVIESDGANWETDSTGDRHLSWVWYKAPGATEYRNLNIELLQEGLGRGSKASEGRYGALCSSAIYQATQLKLNIWSGEKDPDFFYGESIELDLKELRLNIDSYSGKRVAFEGVVSYYVNQGVYVEDFDEETNMYFGIYVYYGFFLSDTSVLTVGNKVRISGVVQYYEAGDSYQVSDLKYNAFLPSADDIRLIEAGHEAANVEITPAQFNSQVPVTVTTVDPDTQETTTETKNLPFAQLAMNTSVSMKGLKVKSAYTTDNGGNNDGAMTLTCEADGKKVTVRTIVLKDSQGNYATEDMLVGKTIDVTGVIDRFNGTYQIKIISLAGILVDGELLFPPVEPTPPPVDSSSDTASEETSEVPEAPEASDTTSNTTSDTESSSSCGSIVAMSALLPMAVAAVVLMKKREN